MEKPGFREFVATPACQMCADSLHCCPLNFGERRGRGGTEFGAGDRRVGGHRFRFAMDQDMLILAHRPQACGNNGKSLYGFFGFSRVFLAGVLAGVMFSALAFLPTDTEFGFPGFATGVESGSVMRFTPRKLAGECASVSINP